MLESHPIASRLGLIGFLTIVLGITAYGLTGQPVFVDEVKADVGPPTINKISKVRVDAGSVIAAGDAAKETEAEKIDRAVKADRLVTASVLGTSGMVQAPAAKRDFKGAFNTNFTAADQDNLKRLNRRVDVMGAIIQAAAATDIDPVYLIAVADKESDMKPTDDSSRSSAQGLFQFVDGTWLELVKEFGAKHGMASEAAMIRVVGGQPTVSDAKVRQRILARRDDPYLSAVMAGEMAKRDRDMLAHVTGRDPTNTEAYMAHFLGSGGAAIFVDALRKSPHQSAAALLPSAAQANPTIFYAKVGEQVQALTVAQVFDRIERSIDQRVARYTGVGAGVAKVGSGITVAGDNVRPATAIGALSFAP